MDFSPFLVILAGFHPAVPVILAVLGSLVVIGQAVVIITPSKEDDLAWERLKSIPIAGSLLSALAAFAPIQKK